MAGRPSPTPAARIALYVASVYLAFGLAWIFASDRILAWLVTDAAVLTRIQSIKGAAFVVLSALLVYGTLRFLADDPRAVGPAAGGRHPRLRVQLLALGAVIAAPLVALAAFHAYRGLDSAQHDAYVEVRGIADVVAAGDSRFLRDTRELVAAIAKRPAVRALDPAACEEATVELTRINPQFANALTVRADGSVVCSARDFDKPWPSMADREWLQQALAATGPIVSRPFAGRIANGLLIAASTAILDDGGKPIGVANVTFDPSQLGAPPHFPLVDGAVLAVVDSHGGIMYQGRETPTSFDAHDAAELSRAPADSTDIRRRQGADGVERFYGVSAIDGSDWRVVVGVPVDRMLAASRALVAQTILTGALTLAAIAWAAYVFARRIERPMRAIVQAARAVTLGDRTARAPVAGSREMAEVAMQLNALLDRLPVIEAELRASENRLVDILAAAQEGVVVYDADGGITFANDAVARILRVSDRQSLIGASLRDVVPVDLRGRIEAGMEDRQRGVSGSYEVAVAVDDTVSNWLSISATPLATSDDRFAGGLAFVTDITARKASEARIARLGRLYTMLGQLNEAIVRLSDPQTLFAVACRIAVDEGGIRTAVVGRLDANSQRIDPVATAGPCYGVIGAEPMSLAPGSPAAGGASATAIRTGELQVVSDLANDPRTRYARETIDMLGIGSVATLPLRYDGIVVGVLALYASEQQFFDDEMVLLLRRMADDLSFALDSYARTAERDRAEGEVRTLNATLERRVGERTARLSEAVRELEAFSYSASHDLRSPLRAINGFARVLQEEHAHGIDGEGRQLLDRIAAASAQMGALIDDLLSLARVGRSALELRPVALSRVLDTIVEQTRATVEAKRGRLTLPATLPVVLGDETLLLQIFSNLVNNALEYHRHDVAPEIDIEWHDAGGRIEVSVRDNGIGVEPAHHRKIFEVFRRLHSQAEHPGTGIGLAIVAKAVSLQNGEIRVQSAPNAGATFVVTLNKPGGAQDRSLRDPGPAGESSQIA